MMKLNRFMIVLLAAILIFSSCKKKKDTNNNNNCNLTEANFLGNYKVESVTYKLSASSPDIDGTSRVFNACELDDVTTFNSNHTYTYTDAGTQCTPAGDDTGTWSLSGNNLTFDGVQQKIDTFDCTGFIISETDYDTPGDKITIKFKKQ